MSSVDKLILINETLGAAKTIKKSESLGRVNHIAFLSVKDSSSFSANIKLEHSPNALLDGSGDWITLHDFGTVTTDTSLLEFSLTHVLPTVRAVVSAVSGNAKIEVSLLADRA